MIWTAIKALEISYAQIKAYLLTAFGGTRKKNNAYKVWIS